MRVGFYMDMAEEPDEIPPMIDSWKIIKNDEEFRDELVKFYTEWKHMPLIFSFGHNTHQEHIQFFLDNPEAKRIPYEAFNHKTFTHSSRFLAMCCEKNNIKPDFKVAVHASEPIGARNIQLIINECKKGFELPEDCFLHKWKVKDLENKEINTNFTEN